MIPLLEGRTMTKNDELASLEKSLLGILQRIRRSVALGNEARLQKVAKAGDVAGVVTELREVQKSVPHYAPLSTDPASQRRHEAERMETAILQVIQRV